jgi:hypothetical protein
MTATTYIGELFPDLPAPKTKAEKETPLSHFRRFLAVNKEEGGLVFPAQAAYLCGVTNQSICNYINRGRLQTFEFFGKTYLSAREVEELFELKQSGVSPAGGRGEKLGYIGMASATLEGAKSPKKTV